MNGVLIGTVLMILLGLVFAVIGFVSRRRAEISKSWPTAPGEIITSTIVQHESTDSDGSSSTSYEPVVEYRYTVIGNPMMGKKIAFGANQFDYRTAQKVVARYPAGAQVQVHYNPDKPTEAVLETRANGGLVFLVIGVVSLIVGILIPVFAGG